MAVDFYYKGLMENNDFFPYTPEQSAEKAKGSMYEAWFDALKASPWYMDMCEGATPPSDAARACYEKFGNIKRVSFNTWWLETGYRIFAEQTRYEGVQVHEVTAQVKLKYNKKTGKLNNLLIEVPLNIHPRKLKEQFDEILANQSRYYEHKNRFAESDADVTFDRDRKMDYKTIKRWLDVYKAVDKQRNLHGTNVPLYEICRSMDLNSKLFAEFGAGTIVDDPDIRQRASNMISEYYQKAQRLIANATEMIFPCVDDNHTLMDIQSRQRRT